MPCRNAAVAGRTSGAMPIGASACTARLSSTNSPSPSPSASHSACRNSGPISARRPAPTSCATDGGSAISVPIGTSITSQNRAVPTATPARVLVPWRPAITLSTKPISPVARWPATSGAASAAVERTSPRRRAGGAGGDMGGIRRRGDPPRRSRSRWRRVGGDRILGDAPVSPHPSPAGPASMSTAPDPAAPALPPEPPRGDCANCGTPLLGEHCYACGQPVKGLVRHFSSLVGDVFDSVFEWDARTPRTLWPLLARPGHLTLEYFAGRRVRYVSPFRLFFFMAIVAFFVGRLTISFGDQNPVPVGGDSGIETARSIVEVEQARDRALAEIAASRAKFEDGPAPPDGAVGAVGRRAAEATLRAGETAIRAQAEERIAAFRAADAQGGPPPVPRLHRLSFGTGDWDPDTNPVTVAWLPGFANRWLNRQIGRAERNVQRLREDPDLLKDSLLGAVPSTLFVLLPLFALMLKLAYVFKRRLYMEHLIVALHSHAFVCLGLLLVFVVMALERWLAPGGGTAAIAFDLVEAALWTWMPLHLLLMQKRVYGQGWFP